MVSIFILLNEIQEKLHFIKGIEITNVIHVKSHFLIQGTWTHIDSVHNCQKDHKCNSCGKSFSQAENLKKHINSVHNGQKDNKCETCGKAFSDAGKSKRHINAVHKGQKDHKCDSCGKSFTEAGSLKKHINSVHN